MLSHESLLKEIKKYHKTQSREYMDKLLDSDSEEFWEEYVSEEMKKYVITKQ